MKKVTYKGVEVTITNHSDKWWCYFVDGTKKAFKSHTLAFGKAIEIFGL